MKRKVFLFLLTLLFCAPAMALVEVRGHYAVGTTVPKDFNDAWNSSFSGYPALPAPTILGADAVVNFMNIVGGLRYESISMAKDGDYTISSVNISNTTKFTGSRLALLAGYRFIDLGNVFLGGLASFGLTQKGDYTTTFTTLNTTQDYEGTLDSTYSLGVEGGLKFSYLLVGAEAGYMSYKVKEFKNKSTGGTLNLNGSAVTLDISGPYVRAMVGVAF